MNIYEVSTLKFKATYHARNEKTREQIPQGEEESGKYGTNLWSWSQCDNHHPIQCELHKGHHYHVQEPEESFCFPRKSHHGV